MNLISMHTTHGLLSINHPQLLKEMIHNQQSAISGRRKFSRQTADGRPSTSASHSSSLIRSQFFEEDGNSHALDNMKGKDKKWLGGYCINSKHMRKTKL